MADIDANTKKAAQLGSVDGHAPIRRLPTRPYRQRRQKPAGSRTNSTPSSTPQRKEIHTYNQSVDAMRAGSQPPYPKQSTPPTSPVPTPSTAAQREGHTPYDDICPPSAVRRTRTMDDPGRNLTGIRTPARPRQPLRARHGHTDREALQRPPRRPGPLRQRTHRPQRARRRRPSHGPRHGIAARSRIQHAPDPIPTSTGHTSRSFLGGHRRRGRRWTTHWRHRRRPNRLQQRRARQQALRQRRALSPRPPRRPRSTRPFRPRLTGVRGMVTNRSGLPQ
uniref:Uncharacterized protein n=1 Tax=Mycobacterium celatum TaxID=28045 RepID=Q93S63_MYCCE|nr:unknown [Mycobacterium celatum]